MSKVILIGSPNSGKSLLFNRLTGLQQKVANFPGITVDVGMGRLKALPDMELIDFPGTYSLQAISAEEEVAVDYFERALDDLNWVVAHAPSHHIARFYRAIGHLVRLTERQALFPIVGADLQIDGAKPRIGRDDEIRLLVCDDCGTVIDQ